MTTTLEVLNHMLNVIGESPITDPASSDPSAQSAMVELKRVKREFQTRGWFFNTEYELPLQPNESGAVVIPSGTLYIDPLAPFSKLTRRGAKLYDPVRHTFNIATTVLVNVILELSVEDLPESAAMYLMHKAAYDFYVNDDGDETKATRLKQRVDEAWAALQSEELRISGVNAKYRPLSQWLKSGMRQQGSSLNPRFPGGRPI